MKTKLTLALVYMAMANNVTTMRELKAYMMGLR